MSNIHLKICGVMEPVDAIKLAGMGVDFIGLNFIPDSRRAITQETAQHIRLEIQDSETKTVALFRDQPLDYILEIIKTVEPDMVQLHGSEHHSYIDAIHIPTIKAVPIGRDASHDEVESYMDRYTANYYLLDRETQGRGEGVDLKLAQLLIDTNERNIILAGGIAPENIDEILAQIQPFGIDISSGVRTNNEIDFSKVERIITSIRSGS